MKIFTNTPRLQKYRRMILELLLSNHCGDCTICEKNGTCKLQELALKLGLKKIRFEKPEAKFEIDDSSISLVRNPNKCIICGDCVRMCEEILGIGVLGFAYRGAQIKVTPFDRNLQRWRVSIADNVFRNLERLLSESCGRSLGAINQPDTRVVVQTLRRSSRIGREFDFRQEIVTGKLQLH